jgi:hypothetical protein
MGRRVSVVDEKEDTFCWVQLHFPPNSAQERTKRLFHLLSFLIPSRLRVHGKQIFFQGAKSEQK